MLTLYNSKGRRLTSLFVILCLVSAMLLPMARVMQQNAFASEGTFDTFMFSKWVTNASGTLIDNAGHFRISDGAIAYCLDEGKPAPDGYAYSPFAPSEGEQSMMRAALTYGYPNVTSIEGYPLSDEQAICATQLAVWALRGAFDLNDLSPAGGSPGYPTLAQNVLGAAKALFLRAQVGHTETKAIIHTPASDRLTLFNNAYLRIGPFITENAISVSAAQVGAPPGTFFGSGNGQEWDAASIPANTEFFCYVPRNEDISKTIDISISATYSLDQVTYYGAVSSEVPQDMVTYERTSVGNVSANISALPAMSIEIEKLDSGTGTPHPQGNASIEGAVYGVYSKEDNFYPGGGTAYNRDQLIGTITTDFTGKGSISNLVPIKYYVKEITASKGYLIDGNIYEADGTNGADVSVILRTVTSKEKVKKQAFQLIKIGATDSSTEVDLLKAGFKIYLISELKDVRSGKLAPEGDKWAAADFGGYEFELEHTANIDGVGTDELFTGEDGYLKSPELPYGDYVVIETTIPKGKKAMEPFVVNIGDDSRTPQTWRVMNDEEADFHLRIVKKDSDTGEVVLGKSAKYRIYDMNNDSWVKMKTTYPSTVYYGTEENPFETDANGSLITPQKLKYGKYKIVEVTAPDGYVLAGKERTPKAKAGAKHGTKPAAKEAVIVDFDKDLPVYFADADEDIIEVSQYNEQKKGRLTISKFGDVKTETRHREDGSSEIKYDKRPLPGAAFSLIADEDITAQDGSGVIVYKTGDVVSTVVTDDEGQAYVNNLLIGKYILRETAAPANYLPTDDIYVTISSEDDGAIICKHFDIEDELIKPLIYCEVDKDTIRTTSAAYRSLPNHEGIDNVGTEKYRYDIDFRSTSNIYGEEFVVDDLLENVNQDKVRLIELWTPIVWGDMDGLFNIWIKTNKTDDQKVYSQVNAMNSNPANPENPFMKAAYPNTGFMLWKEGVKADVREHLTVAALGLDEDEYITALRLEFGGVMVGFTSKNYSDISLNGEHRERDWVQDDYVNWTPVVGTQYYAEGAATAAGLAPVTYMVSANKMMLDESIESTVTARIARDFELRDRDDDNVITKVLKTFTYTTVESSPVKTGDNFDVIFWAVLALLSALILLTSLYMRRRITND